MDKFEKGTIKIEADACARLHKLEAGRVRKVFYKLYEIDWFSPNFPFRTAFDSAISHVGPARALKIFESTNVKDTLEKQMLFDYLCDPYSSHYTLAELAEHTEALIDHLKKNETPLAKTGYARSEFTQSKWLNMRLNSMYPTTEFNGKPFRSLAPKGQDLCPADAEAGAAKRRKLLALKTQILSYLSQGLRKKDDSGLWERCLHVLTNELNRTDIDLCLRLDRFLVSWRVGGMDISPFMDDWLRIAPPQIIGVDGEVFHAGLCAGGLTDILDFIGHYEKELNIGTMAKTKEVFNCFPDSFSFSSYYANIGRPCQSQLDRALDQFIRLESDEKAFWREYNRRVNSALESEFDEYVEIKIPIKQKYKMVYESIVRTFAQWQKSQLEATGQPTQLRLSSVDSDDTKVCPKFMSATELACYFDIQNKEALRKRLERFRRKHKFDADAFCEVQNPGRTQARFLWNVERVKPLVEQLKKREVSAKLRSNKK